MNKDDFKKLSAEIAKKQYEFVMLGEQFPRKMAYAFVGVNQTPPVTGEEMASLYSYAMKEHGVKNETSEAEIDEDTVTYLYQKWADTNSEIASDKQLAFFTGYSRQAFYYARTAAIKNGYKFESIAYGEGWRVVEVPEIKNEKIYTAADMEKAIADFVRNMKK